MPLWGMLVSSTYGIVALTFERFLAIVYPIWHKTKFNRNKARLYIIYFITLTNDDSNISTNSTGLQSPFTVKDFC